MRRPRRRRLRPSAIRRTRPIVTEDFKFLHAAASKRVKVTMPTPSHMHFGQFKDAVDRNVYPDVEQYWEDMITVFRQEIDELYAVGCRYLQLDEVPLALLCDPNIRALAKQEGDDPDQLVRRYVDIFNRAVAQRPDDMTIAMHVCRGNMESLWMGDGGYAPVAEVLFRDCDVDAYLLEYDSPRAGDFAPLRHLPAGKRAYLGLISTKNPALESSDDLMRRLDEAAKYAPMARLGICPQCGFASAAHVEVRCHAEQGHDRPPDLEDRTAARSRPARLGARVSQALAEADTYGLFTAAAVRIPIPITRSCASATRCTGRSKRRPGTSRVTATCSSCRTDRT